MGQGHLLGISGSLRAGSCNSMLIREAARLFDPATFVEGDLQMPLYDGDIESADGVPEAARVLAGQIAQADAVVISTPEYNKGPSGVLKNALDWVSRGKPNPWAGKPVAVMSAAAGRAGGERAQMVLRGFLVPFQPRVISGPEVHLADCANQFDTDGRLVGPQYADTLARLVAALQSEVARGA